MNNHIAEIKKNMNLYVLYIIAGIMTTGVNFLVFYILFQIMSVDVNISNIISIISAIIFAYITNKVFVFKSQCSTFKELFSELIKFILSRFITFCIEVAGFFILFLILPIYPMYIKILISLIVLISNYCLSRYYVFKI